MADAGPRLFLRAALREGATAEIERGQTHYLVNVLRLKPGESVRLFNGRDGEWRAVLAERRRVPLLELVEQIRPQTDPPDLHYLFAPLKQGRLDYMVQKAVELGAGVITPVLTRHTQIGRVNRERMESNAIEAAEQCGLLTVPQVDETVELEAQLADWPQLHPGRRIIFCDESSTGMDPIVVLSTVAPGPVAILIGPEGGFSAEERERLRSLDFVTALPLGPRILRADTAAVAALALVQAVIGDWRHRPPAEAPPEPPAPEGADEEPPPPVT